MVFFFGFDAMSAYLFAVVLGPRSEPEIQDSGTGGMFPGDASNIDL